MPQWWWPCTRWLRPGDGRWARRAGASSRRACAPRPAGIAPTTTGEEASDGLVLTARAAGLGFGPLLAAGDDDPPRRLCLHREGAPVLAAQGGGGGPERGPRDHPGRVHPRSVADHLLRHPRLTGRAALAARLPHRPRRR